MDCMNLGDKKGTEYVGALLKSVKEPHSVVCMTMKGGPDKDLRFSNLEPIGDDLGNEEIYHGSAREVISGLKRAIRFYLRKPDANKDIYFMEGLSKRVEMELAYLL